MDLVELPLVRDHESPDEAIRRMRAAKRHAVVVLFEDGEPRVMRSVDILRAWARGAQALRDARPGESIAPFRVSPDVETVVRNPGLDWKAHVSVREALSRIGSSFGLDAESRWQAEGSVRLVTRHEDIRGDLESQVQVCVCDQNPYHNEDSPPAQDGKPCRFCSGKYRCA